MLSASCPSCGSPLTFPHAAAVTTVCPACHACVVREDVDLRDFGKVAQLPRDLSPLQIGARGEADGQSFQVIGVLRREKSNARWNEWCLLFTDGTFGWLGEGNGQFQLFGKSFPWPGADMIALTPGEAVTAPDGQPWVVAEASEASLTAAEGSFPSPISPFGARRYADLRKTDGVRVATLDLSETPAVFFTGRVVDLPALKLVGLKSFAGWSDPALVAFDGPQISSTRALTCPNCGAGLSVRAPGLTQRMACEYCGSTMDVDAEGDLAQATLLAKATRPPFSPPIPLGARGKLEGVEWEVIGAMVRYVLEDGIEYCWDELFLFNPYHGSAWLVRDTQNHWSFVELLPCLPDPDATVSFKGASYRRFQGGTATVKHVLGEFTWQVRAGDSASTIDFVAPPYMLSVEASGDEVTWSRGQWLSPDTVGAAFRRNLARSTGVGPHQPNPYTAPAAKAEALVRFGVLALAAVVVVNLALWLPDREVLLDERVMPPGEDDPYVSKPLVLAESDVVAVHVNNAVAGSVVEMATLYQEESSVFAEWQVRKGSTDQSWNLPKGTWHLRVSPVQGSKAGETGFVDVRVQRQPGSLLCPALAALFALLAPLAALLDRLGFESRRWANAGGS